jgi:hypothetical protein
MGVHTPGRGWKEPAMSTLPDDAWRDAGLEDTDDTTSLVEEAKRAARRDTGDRPEEYHPGTARPDLEGAAAEADVVEQSREVPGADEGGGEAEDSGGAGADR